jgi:hypothetical protein
MAEAVVGLREKGGLYNIGLIFKGKKIQIYNH